MERISCDICGTPVPGDRVYTNSQDETICVTCALAPSTLPLQGGGWAGVLVHKSPGPDQRQIYWQCPHYHANQRKQRHAPQSESYQQHPHLRSAQGCAAVEFGRRLEAQRLGTPGDPSEGTLEPIGD